MSGPVDVAERPPVAGGLAAGSAAAPLSAEPEGPARLNPFAFPSDTDFRLLLMAAAVFASALFINNWVYLGMPWTRSDLATYRACQQAAQAASPTDFLAANRVFESCRAPIEHAKAVWMLAGTAAMGVLAVALYLLTPPVRLRRRRLRALTEEDVPEVLVVLDRLSRNAGLDRMPRFVWDPLNGAAVGHAFGRPGRCYIALTGGLVTRFYTDRPAFEAVVRHELAHVRNGDVGKTYLALSLWWAFVALGLVPLLVTIVLQPTPAAAAGVAWLVLWRAAALAVLVYAVRNAVLRSRELYADVRATTWDGPGGALRRVVAALPQPAGKAGAARWLRLLALHPDPAFRVRVIRDTDPLFRVGFWEALAAGISAAIAYPSLVTVAGLLTTGVELNIWYLSTPQVVGLLASTLLALLVAGVVGVGVWRAAITTLIKGWPRPSLPPLAAGLAVGLAAGEWVALEQIGAPLPATAFSWVVAAAAYLLWFAVLAAGLLGVVRWCWSAACAALRSELARPAPPPWLPVLLMTAVAFAIWLGLAFQVRDIGEAAAAQSLPPVIIAFLAGNLVLEALLSPLILLGLVAVWGFPLWFALKASPGVAGAWMFLDLATSRPATAAGRVDLRRLVATAAWGALIYLALIVVVRLSLRLTVPASRITEGYQAMLFTAEVVLAAGVQGYVAAAVALRAHVVPICQALGAAFLAGAAMSVEALLLTLALDGGINITLAWLTANTTLVSGALLAALFAGGMRLLAPSTKGVETHG